MRKKQRKTGRQKSAKSPKTAKERSPSVKSCRLRFNEKGLIPAIIQDVKTKDVLMIAYMNAESLKITLEEKRTCFYSRSREKLWRKGETSGHIQKVESIHYDCDKDALLVMVAQTGVACHTGEWSCFHRKIL